MLSGGAHAAAAPLHVVLLIDGRTFTFREQDGRDLGDFVSEIGGFTQRCIRTDVPDSPLRVYFRPDRTSDRAEVVFERGGVFDTVAENLGAYQVRIFRGETLLADIAVPEHYHHARWRWQSTPRAVVGNVDQLIAQGLLPPYDRSAAPGAPPPTNPPPQDPPKDPPPTPEPPKPTTPEPPPPPPAPTPPPAPAPTPAPQPVPDVPAAPQPVTQKPPRGFQPMPDPGWALSEYLSALFGGAWMMSTGDRRPGILESVAIGTAVGALAAKAFQMSTAKGEESAPDVVGLKGAQTYEIMGLAGVHPYMPNTGERDDIGLLTEPQARFVCTNDPDALLTLIAQGEAAATVPWHMRDENTNAPINMRTYPGASWYWDARVGDPWVRTARTPITPDSAHMPALSYLPYLLTGDPYYLEELQFMANWIWGSGPPAYRPWFGQSRALAWFLRSLSQCARVTPQRTPDWLLPREYWSELLTENRRFLETAYVNSPGPVCAIFRSTGDVDGGRDEGASAPAGTWIDPWQEEFLAAVIGWMIRMGFTEWQTVFDWKIGSTIARTRAGGEWARALATPYRIILRESRDAPLARSWSEALALTVRLQEYGDVSDRDTWLGNDLTYLAYTRGALVMAKAVGTAGLEENITWATDQMRGRGWRTAYKWRIGSGLSE
jgi:hypothetical protein